MPKADALTHAVSHALSTVASTIGLSWAVKGRLFRQMARAIRAQAYRNPTPEDFAVWAGEELADLLSDEDIRPLCRLALAEWFAAELLNWLTGDFDDAA
ncbi:hypothetical protein [Deinococcus sp.]|uniref:hypothetical protein n=1 Tax=Deinococcus sp. TaxID=47478 RepID=UPI003CC55CFF